jgi:hypothetical protein
MNSREGRQKKVQDNLTETGLAQSLGDVELASLHYYGLMDQTYAAMVHFGTFVNGHEVIRENPGLSQQAQDIIDRMYALYNAISAMADRFDPETREWLDAPPRGRELI